MNNIAVIGNPNVGKSAVLNRLTGSQFMVSNYPGTSVEIAEASMKIGPHVVDIYDTPGIYSLCAEGAPAQAEIDFLTGEAIDLIINIVDASNMARNLVLSLELLEIGKPVLILLNQMDRVRAMGMNIDSLSLSRQLGAPVLTFSAATGEGLEELLEFLHRRVVHRELNEAERLGEPSRGTKASGEGVPVLRLDSPSSCDGFCTTCSMGGDGGVQTSEKLRVDQAQRIADSVTARIDDHRKMQLDRIQALVDRPLLGTLIILVVAYLAFRLLLSFIAISEGPLSGLLDPVNVLIEELIAAALPPGMLNTVLSKAVPEGLIIPFTIIMPAMLMVSFLMALLEDTGLLPRYSVALERLGSVFGVSGQAVIPLSLGFGCRTPAILATRLLPSEAQRFIIVTLLSIVIPCSATLGILASVIAAFQASLPIIVLTMLFVMLLLAYLLSRMMPIEDEFLYELPPLRVPLARNLGSKMKIRFSGFFTEILPLLLLMSIGIRIIMESGFLEVFRGMEAFTRLMFGIPAEAFVAVLITIFQRYLAPIVLMNLALTPREATIAISMIALSLPCLPMMVMTIRELGIKSLVKILGLGLSTSAAVGILLNLILPR